MEFLTSAFWGQLISRALLLTLLGAAFLVPFRVGYTNLALTAQLISSALVMLYLVAALENALLAILGGTVVAFSVSFIPVFLRVRRNVDEVLTTLFLSYTAVYCSRLVLRLSSTAELMITTPTVPLPARLSGLWVSGDIWFIKRTSWLWEKASLVHLAAIPMVFLLWFLYDYRGRVETRRYATVIGLRAVALRHGLKSTSAAHMWALALALLLSTTCSSLYAVADVYLERFSYSKGLYDTLGFLGVAVGLLAVRSILLLPLAGLLVAFIERSFLVLSNHGWPQSTSHFLLGMAILIVAVVVRDRQPLEDF